MPGTAATGTGAECYWVISMACFGLSAGGYDNIAEESVLHLRVYRV